MESDVVQNNVVPEVLALRLLNVEKDPKDVQRWQKNLVLQK